MKKMPRFYKIAGKKYWGAVGFFEFFNRVFPFLKLYPYQREMLKILLKTKEQSASTIRHRLLARDDLARYNKGGKINANTKRN